MSTHGCYFTTSENTQNMLPEFHGNILPVQEFEKSNRILVQLNIVPYQVKPIDCHGLPSGPERNVKFLCGHSGYNRINCLLTRRGKTAR